MDWPGGDPSEWAFPPAHDIETKRALKRLECEETAWGRTAVTLSEVVSPGDCFACWDGKESWKVDNWLAEGALRRKSVALLVGEAGTGKTYAAWDLIISVLRGEKWLGHFECECGPVYYQGGEGQEDMLRRRHLGMCLGRNIDIRAFNDHELRWLTFYVPRRSPEGYPTVPPHPLSIPTFRERLLRAVSSRPPSARPALFVFDPLVTMVRNIDTDTQEATAVMNWALELAEVSNACVLLLHHMNKSEERSQRGRIRGESTWVNLAQTVYVMEQAKHDADTALFYDNKQRDDASDKARARFAVKRFFEPVLDPAGFLEGAEPGVVKATQLLYMPGKEAEDLEKAYLEAQAEEARAARAAGRKNGAEAPLSLSLPEQGEGESAPLGVVVRDSLDGLAQHIETIERHVLTAGKPVTQYGCYTALKDAGLGKGHPVVKRIVDQLVAEGRIVYQRVGSRDLYLAPMADPSTPSE